MISLGKPKYFLPIFRVEYDRNCRFSEQQSQSLGELRNGVSEQGTTREMADKKNPRTEI